MDKDIVLWIFGIMVTANSTAICAGVVGYISIVQRLTKMETTLALMGFNAAKALHSPHTPELDSLLEKYMKDYEDKNYDLPYEDWVKLKKICDEILEDRELAAGYRAAAGIVQALCTHKLMRWDILKGQF